MKTEKEIKLDLKKKIEKMLIHSMKDNFYLERKKWESFWEKEIGK